jgi:BirA family biotin operon repressor/biotin-[acetyl-CoA-carboxylase] ligase
VHSPPADDYEAALRSVLPVAGFGDPLRYLTATTSTNDEALDWASQGAPEGALVVAGHQSAGRGRRGRTWHAPPGSALLFSLVLRPELSPERLGLLTTALGVAGAEAARSFGLDAKVKWPNDVMVEGRKLAGVLVESRLSGDRVEAVAGMGFNISVERISLPKAVGTQAASLHEHLQKVPGRVEVLADVLAAFGKNYQLINSEVDSDKVLRRAEELSAVMGQSVEIRRADGGVTRGAAQRLTKNGALVVRTGEDEVVVETGEIEQLRPL